LLSIVSIYFPTSTPAEKSITTIKLTLITISVIITLMIKSFSDKHTEDLFNREKVKKFPPSILKLAYRKLLLIDAAGKVDDLRVPPGNRLEKLSGNMFGKQSIRINNQWRIVFQWKEDNAYDVKIMDYHKG
jgi:proteic killer suppression protein